MKKPTLSLLLFFLLGCSSSQAFVETAEAPQKSSSILTSEEGAPPYESIAWKEQLPYPAILIVGPPGSGKGTLCSSLSQITGHYHLSSGDIFRKISQESPLGQLYHSYADKGLLLPDSLAIEIWHRYVEGLVATHRYFPDKQFLLLDGIPRTLAQAVELEKYVKVVQLILLEVEDLEELQRRISQRSLIEHRRDDKDRDAFLKRISIYSEERESLLSHYPPSMISRFNAAQKPLELLRDILDQHTDLLSSEVTEK